MRVTIASNGTHLTTCPTGRLKLTRALPSLPMHTTLASQMTTSSILLTHLSHILTDHLHLIPTASKPLHTNTSMPCRSPHQNIPVLICIIHRPYELHHLASAPHTATRRTMATTHHLDTPAPPMARLFPINGAPCLSQRPSSNLRIVFLL